MITKIITVIVDLLFDMMNVTVNEIGKTGNHLIRGILLVLIVSTVTDQKIEFGDWGNFSFGSSSSSSSFSTGDNTGSYRIPYDNYSVSTAVLHGLSGWEGVDIVAGCGAEIYSPISGIVDKTGTDGYIGPISNGAENTWVGISNTSYSTVLLHGEYIVNFGDTVEQGQVIGYESSIGNSSGCHTHWIMYEKGMVFNGLY